MLRSTLARYTLNPFSVFDLSLQDRLIWLDDAAVAVRFVGAAGVGVGAGVAVGVGLEVGAGVGDGKVVALAVFDQADPPPLFVA
jgi:dynactin complex subunit